MKKVIGIFLIAISTFMLSFGQDNTYYNNNDDAYYSDNGNNYGNDYDQTYNQAAYNNNGVDDQGFYDQLSPYGNWVYEPGYGNVWVPTQVSADFSPYLTGGHWVYTDYGWTWASDYSWGWAPFHYGRWFFDAAYGWAWMPGYEWAPAWVVWGEYGNNYCWAPIAPYCDVTSYYRPEDHCRWNFIPQGYIAQSNLTNYVVNNTVIVNNITEVNNHITIINEAGNYNNHKFFAGPKAQDVERASGQKISRITVAGVNHPVATKVSGNQLNLYRPEMSKSAIQHMSAPVKSQQTIPRNNGMASIPANNIQRGNLGRSNTENQQKPQQFSQPMQQNTVRENISRPEQKAYNQNQFMQQPVERNSAPVQRPVQQQFSQQVKQNPVRENVTAPQQRTINQNVRMQQPVERNFASNERPAQRQTAQPTYQNTRPSFNAQAFRGGRR